MRLYIVRHGQAGPAASDSERPLSPEGRAEVAKLGEFVRREGIQVAALWHSPKVRARETAQVLAQAAGLSAPLEEHTGLLPEDDPAVIAAQLETSNDDLCLVSHMPYVANLVSLLVPDRAPPALRFTTATMACLERERVGVWRLLRHVAPDAL